MQLPIGGGYYESDSLPISNQQLKNLYVNVPQTEGALSQETLLETPGLVQILTTGKLLNANRGSHVKNGIYYFLNGEVLYRLERAVTNNIETFTSTVLGTIPGSERASFSDNGTQLMVVAGGEGYIINEANLPVFELITDAGFKANGVPKQVVFIDSFFLVTTDSKKFIRSDSNDGTSWSALNFFTAEADPDDIVAPIIFKNQAFILGSETIEVFQDVAGSFQRISGMIIDKGLFAPFGIAKTSNSFMFVGGGVNESPSIWSVSGNSAQKVSTTAIDAVLRRFSQEDIEACFAMSYAQSGAFFISFTFPEITFVFDTVTNKWHERGSRITTETGSIVNARWRANSLQTAYNKVICADSIDGRIGILSLDTHEEYENIITRTFSMPAIQNGMNSFSISELELTMESGTGLAGEDAPVVRLSVSKDAKTFNDELARTYGKIGEYNKRAIWRMLGRFSRMAILKFEFSNNTKTVIIRADIKIIGGQ